MMKKKNTKAPRRSGTSPKSSGTRSSVPQSKPTESAADAAPQTGMAAQLLGAQRKLWQAGVDAFSRGSKVGGGAGSITESLQGGLRKLEDVFDQRVLSSLSHAGMPSPAEIRKLMERVQMLEAQVRRSSRRRSKG
jgi:Poly(hydroxyalcanoate) granule associated protein (phasin)